MSNNLPSGADHRGLDARTFIRQGKSYTETGEPNRDGYVDDIGAAIRFGATAGAKRADARTPNTPS